MKLENAAAEVKLEMKFLPSSGHDRPWKPLALTSENHVKSISLPSFGREHQGTFDPERAGNTRHQSVSQVCAESLNVLRTWWRSEWEQGEWP